LSNSNSWVILSPMILLIFYAIANKEVTDYERSHYRGDWL
jgi:hypothetical protein